MKSRRELSLLLPAAFAAIQARAQTPAALPSKVYKYDGLPVRVNGENRSRAVLNGKTRNGYGIEMHETELGPGLAPHASHHHVHEEMVIVREGTIEVTISGKSETLGPGSVAYVASNEEHGWRNIGNTRARYYIITLGR
jgi:quercetin dioxygenase-like cupin family protein